MGEAKYGLPQHNQIACRYKLPQGLLYATDSPLDKDYIFLMSPETGELKEIMPIAGSCIYGCKWKDRYVFGAVRFPYGENNGETLWFQPVAVRKGDLRLIGYNLEGLYQRKRNFVR